MTLPYRLAAIDLDDTLLGPDKQISVGNAAAIQRLRAAGVHVTLASGRRHENMLRFHKQLDLSGPIVSCNGALVKDAESGDVLFERLLPPEHAAAIIEEGDRIGITQNYYHANGGLYVREKTGWTSLYESRTSSEVTPIGALEQFGGESALKIIWIDAPERIAALHEVMRQRFPDLYITTTDAEYLEFMALGVSKAFGVGVVAERRAVPREAVVTFGDGNNDVPMLEWAGAGVAMAHALPAAKAVADHIAPPGDPETSLARAIEVLLTLGLK